MNHLRVNRRTFLRTSAGMLLAANAWPGSLAARDAASGTFSFAVVNDWHVTNEKCLPWFQKVVASTKSHSPGIDFVLLVGDLTEDGTPTQIGLAADVITSLGVPVWPVIGNHDYQKPADRTVYEKQFKDRLNYCFEHQGWRFIGLDTSDGVKYEKVSAGKPTLQWLADHAPKWAGSMPTVLFTHFPLGTGVRMQLVNSEAVLEPLKGVNLKAVFNGHFHAFTEKKRGEIPVTTNRCCSFAKGNHDGTKEKGYFLVRAKDGTLTRTFVEVKPG